MRIGIVEDNAIISEMLRTAFTLHGHDVMLYETGFAFLSSLQTEQPLDVLLIDLLLPGGLSGRETLQSFYQLAPETTLPIVVVSGAGRTVIEEVKQSFPGIPIVEKPASLKKLIALVEQLSPTH